MTRKFILSSAAALALASTLSGCGGRVDESEYLVQVPMSEASYQNLYGAYANQCANDTGAGCNPDESSTYN